MVLGWRTVMSLMTIGEFALRSRLSPKALRLYDQMGLLVPADTDPANGYRFYSEDQVERARTVGLLRRLDMPLQLIAEVLDAPGPTATKLLGDFWNQVEAITAERRSLVAYIQARLTGGNVRNYDIQTRRIHDRHVVSITRHLHAAETDAFFNEAFSRLRRAAPGLQGIDGAPYLVFYGDVSEDSDGPMELCRPINRQSDMDLGQLGDDIEIRLEAAHDEAYVRLSMAEMGWPAILPVVDALELWTTSHRRRPGGALRQVLIADQRTAAPTTLVCDLTIPLA
jgi:DNA-binding transcriptional MerR regulator